MQVNFANLQTVYRGFSAAFSAGFGQAPQDHMLLTMESRSGTSVEEYPWLGQVPSMEEFLGERVVRQIAEHGYTIRNRAFHATVRVRREKIEDDTYGTYAPIFREFGRASAAHPCELVYQALKDGWDNECYDGQNFFDTDHPGHGGVSVGNTDSLGNGNTHWFLADASRMLKPIIYQRRVDDMLVRKDDPRRDDNVFMRDEFLYGNRARRNVGYGLWQHIYGSRTPITPALYADAVQALREMQGDQGRPLGLKPTHLFVAPDQEAAAREILIAERKNMGATNVWQGTAELIVSSWLA